MPVTSLWRVKGDVAAVVRYAGDAQKTRYAQDQKTVSETMERQGGTEGEFSVYDLHAVADYATRDSATTWKDGSGIVRQLVSGINCDPDTAVEEMRWTKRRFQKTGGTAAYHGYQSFAQGEGPPDLIHQIGVETARKLWGDRFQVLVATHVDHPNHIHNHFVLCTVSFVDGKKYYRSARDYAEFRRVSDELALQYGFRTIDQPQDARPRDYTPGRMSWRKIGQADVDAAIRQARTDSHFLTILRSKGYEIKQGKDMSVRAPGAQRFLRLERNFGANYTRAAIRRRIAEQWQVMPSKRKPRKMTYRGGLFCPRQPGKKKLHGLQALYIRYCFLLGILPAKRKQPSTRVSPALKQDLTRLRQISEQARLLCRHQIGTLAELRDYRAAVEIQLAALKDRRKELNRRQRLASVRSDPEAYQINREQIDTISRQCRQLRKEIRLCDSIADQYQAVAEKVEGVGNEQVRAALRRQHEQREFLR